MTRNDGLVAIRPKGQLYVGKIEDLCIGNDGYYEISFEGADCGVVFRCPLVTDEDRHTLGRIKVGDLAILCGPTGTNAGLVHFIGRGEMVRDFFEKGLIQ